jgi:Flagellar capping protein
MSTLRITGLASGIDYESMITKIMDAQRVPLDKLNQKKQINQWVQDDYRALNNKILDFKNAAFDMKLQSGYLTKTATSSNTNVATVTGTANAIEGAYTLQVQKLAKAATFTSGTLTGTTVGKDTTISVNGVNIGVKSTDSYQDLASKINAESVKTGVKVAYDSTLKTMFFSSTKTGASANIDLRGAEVGNIFKTQIPTAATTTGSKKLTSETSLGSLAGESISFTIDGQGEPFKFDITSSTKMGELITKMNDSLKDTGVSVSLNSDGYLTINNPDNSKAIDFTTDSDPAVVNALGLTDAKPTPTIHTVGQNAKVSFNGVTGEYDTNTFTIAGLSITAKQEQTGDDVTNINVTQDTDAVFNKIKSFVDKYNDLISTINSELSEEKYRDFAPLTDAQKKEMSEDQIKQWEEKAKSGMLANDTTLSNSLYKMRQVFSSSVSGLTSLDSLSKIGISSSLISGSAISGSYLDKGKLYIDESKLKQMISEKPDEVMALFTTNDNDDSTSDGDGIATRLYSEVSGIFNQIVAKAGTSTSVKNTFVLGKESLELDKRISALQTRLDDMETRYYNQFTAMEKYISQMNARSTSLASLLNSGG